MIDKNVKALATAKMRLSYPIEDIAEELEIPLALVKQWHRELNPNDLTALNANTIAIGKVLSGEVLDDNSVEKLESKLVEAAIEISDQAMSAATSGDVVFAKSVELAANAVSKLYTSIIAIRLDANKPKTFTPSDQSVTLFQKFMKD